MIVSVPPLPTAVPSSLSPWARALRSYPPGPGRGRDSPGTIGRLHRLFPAIPRRIFGHEKQSSDLPAGGAHGTIVPGGVCRSRAGPRRRCSRPAETSRWARILAPSAAANPPSSVAFGRFSSACSDRGRFQWRRRAGPGPEPPCRSLSSECWRTSTRRSATWWSPPTH